MLNPVSFFQIYVITQVTNFFSKVWNRPIFSEIKVQIKWLIVIWIFFYNIYVFSIVKYMIKVTKNRYLLWYDICIWLPKVLGRFANNYTIYSTQLGLNKQSPKYTLYFYVNNTYARRTLNENTLGSDNTIKLGYVW